MHNILMSNVQTKKVLLPVNVIIKEVCEQFCFSTEKNVFYFPTMSRDNLFPRSVRAAGWKADGQLKGLEDQSARRRGVTDNQRRGMYPEVMHKESTLCPWGRVVPVARLSHSIRSPPHTDSQHPTAQLRWKCQRKVTKGWETFITGNKTPLSL